MFGPFLSLSEPYRVQVFTNTKKSMEQSRLSTHVVFHLVKKPLVLVFKNLKRLCGWEKLNFSTICGPFWCYIMPQWPILASKGTKIIVGTWLSTHVIFNLVKKTLVLVKNNPKEKKEKKYHEFSCNFFFMFKKKFTQGWLHPNFFF